MIDVHAHYLPDFLVEALEAAGRKPALAAFPRWSPQECLAMMDRFGIAATLLSVSTPGVHFGQTSAAAVLARRCNEYCADLAVSSGGRLGGFAALPLPAIDVALAEIEYALDTLELDGVGLLASYGETFLGDPSFDPVLAELNAREAVVFVHPMGHPSSRGLALAAPLWMLEYPFDTTRAALNLMLTGALQRFPRIRFILAHAGGALPFLGGRIAAAALIDIRWAHLEEARVVRDLGAFYYETAQAAGAATLAAVTTLAPRDHILFGSDYPYCSERAIAAMVDAATSRLGARECTLAATNLFPRLRGRRWL